MSDNGETVRALDAARHLAENGVPVFLAKPALDDAGEWDPHGGSGETGYRLPTGWEQVAPDPSVIDGWEPGMALCAVMGHAVDGLDVDPRNGGVESLASLNGTRPRSYGQQSTPSGGTHDLIAPLGVRSLDGVLPGLDLKAGVAGDGHGFLFLAPTRKAAKPTGEVGVYGWVEPPDLGPLILGDDTGSTLRDLVERRRHPEYDGPAYDGPDYADLPANWQRQADAETERVVAHWRERLAGVEDWPDGERDDKGRGWEALSVDLAWALARLAAQPWTAMDEDEAHALYDDLLPDALATNEKCRGKWRDGLVDKAGAAPMEPPAWADFGPIAAVDEQEAEAVVPDRFTQKVAQEVLRLRVAEAAREQIARERLGTVDIPSPSTLADFLAEPDEATRYRIDGLWPTGGRVVLSAPHKAGKTTLTGNLIRSLADGGRFLDHFDVAHAGRIVLIDNELSPNMIRLWLREQGIDSVDSVSVLPLRGRLSLFNVLDPATRTRWAEAIGPADVLVFDCLRPALDSLGLSEDKDAGRFLEAMDELVAEAGIGELMMVHHMGHAGERSRGDSRILDWPDALWKIVRATPDDPTAPRFFSAYGRDVDQSEVRLAYSDFDRRLSIDGGSRRDARTTQIQAVVLEQVASSPGLAKGEVEKAVGGNRDNVRAALDALIKAGRLRCERVGVAHRYWIAETVESAV